MKPDTARTTTKSPSTHDAGIPGKTDALRQAGAALREVLSHKELAFDVPLATVARWRIGGPADIVVTPGSAAALSEALAILSRFDVPRITIGDGSNLLFDDMGYRGAIIRIGRDLGELAIRSDGQVTAGAGIWVPALVRRLIDAELAGAVHAIGIPGTIGGLVTMNGGSQRRGIGEHVQSVTVVDADGASRTIETTSLRFSYRSSALQDSGSVVVSVDLRFARGDQHAMRREAIALLATRRAKFPKIRANCGSVFVSDPALYAMMGPPGAAIERVGLKGMRIGDAQFSDEHANFIVNLGNARSGDVLALIALARRRVEEATGVSMLAEVRYLPPTGSLCPAHEMAAKTPYA